jgi:hypothetical protein
MMDGLPSSILPREARFAHVASAVRLADIYVPFGDPTEARNAKRPVGLGVSVRSTQPGAGATSPGTLLPDGLSTVLIFTVVPVLECQGPRL